MKRILWLDTMYVARGRISNKLLNLEDDASLRTDCFTASVCQNAMPCLHTSCSVPGPYHDNILAHALCCSQLRHLSGGTSPNVLTYAVVMQKPEQLAHILSSQQQIHWCCIDFMTCDLSSLQEAACQQVVKLTHAQMADVRQVISASLFIMPYHVLSRHVLSDRSTSRQFRVKSVVLPAL